VLALEERGLAAFGRTLLGFEFVLDGLARPTYEPILDRATNAIARSTLVALRNSRSRPRLFELVARACSSCSRSDSGPSTPRCALASKMLRSTR